MNDSWIVRRTAKVLTLSLLVSFGVAVASPADAALVPLPSSELGSPAVESIAEGRHEVLARSTSSTLTHQYLLPGGSWRRKLDRGGALASQPVAVSWGPNRLDVFARGTDNTLVHRALSNGTWSSWKATGACSRSTSSACRP